MSSVEIRTISESDFPGWARAVRTGFLVAAQVTDDEVELRRHGVAYSRCLGAYDQGRCVATFGSMRRELTVPGGAVVHADAVSTVTVTATHRRRGLLTRMMRTDLAAARERGEVVAILVAAEYPIYGRFGFGPATWVTDWEVEVSRARLGRFAPPPHGRVDLVEPVEAGKLGPEPYDRFRRLTPGAIDRDERWWELATGRVVYPTDPWEPGFFAVYRDAATGRVDGLAAYRTDETWHSKLPAVNLTVGDLIAATADAERALWRYLLSVDWVAVVRSGRRPPDDVLPLLLGDARAARTGPVSDFLWLRLLDTPRALAARTYAAPGSLVLDVADPMGLAGGRFRLDVAADGTARCAATGEPPDLGLTMSDLSALYLGDESAVRLARLGRLAERSPGAVARAELLLRTPRRPYCPDIF